MQGVGAGDVSVAEAGRTAVACLAGPLDMESAPRLMERLAPILGRCRRVIIDFRRSAYLDSAGVRALLYLQHRLAAGRGELRLVIPPGSRVLQTLTLLHLHDAFPIYERLPDAWSRCGTGRRSAARRAAGQWRLRPATRTV